MTSYKFNNSFGISSTKFKFLKLIVSANASLDKTVLIFVTTVSRIGNLSTNILCFGLISRPYFCLAGNLGSGTLLPAKSCPTRLSIHFASNFSLGRLSATPSVNN